MAAGLAFPSSASARTTSKKTVSVGYLKGRLHIGPVRPVQREGEEDEPPPAWYTAQEILIMRPGSHAIVTRTHGRRDGWYRVSLKPGRYLVDIPRRGVGGAKKLPIAVTILRGRTARLDIDIDTGIR